MCVGMSVEPNTIAASAIFLGGIVIDGLTSADPVDGSEAPTSLRTTALVLLGCLAAPPIRQWMVLEQRVVIGVLLGIVASSGWHELGSGARVADAVYTSVSLGGMIITFWLGGRETEVGPNSIRRRLENHSADAPPHMYREWLGNTATALLFYSSLRLMRAAMCAPDVARRLTVSVSHYDGTVLQSVGYASSSTTAVAATTFGSVAGLGVACVLMIDKEFRQHGTRAATLVLFAGAFAQLMGAFVATVASSEQLNNLPVLWSAAGCNDVGVCKAAFVARRLAVTSASTAGLWVNGIGTLLMAYAPSIRLRTRAEQNSILINFQVTIYAWCGALACVVFLLNYLSFTGAESYTDYLVVVAVLAVPITAFLDTVTGTLLFALSIGIDLIMLVSTHGGGSVFSHFSHCCNGCMTVLMILYALVTGVADLFWRFMRQETVKALDITSGTIAVCGTSIACILYLATSALFASYDGQHISDTHYRASDKRYERSAAVTVAEHWLPLLIWVVLYACRCESELVSTWTRTRAWYAAPALPASIWLGVLIASTHDPTYEWISSAPFVLSLLVVAIVPWLVVIWA